MRAKPPPPARPSNRIMPSATLDTNLLIEYWKNQAKAAVVKRLLDLAQDGQLDLAVTARIREDVPQPPLSNRINKLPEIGVQEIGTAMRLDVGVLDRDYLGDDRFLDVAGEIMNDFSRKSTSPPDWRDWDHVHGHYLAGRDVFLTWDKRILDAADELRDKLSVRVMMPEDYLREWDEKADTDTY